MLLRSWPVLVPQLSGNLNVSGMERRVLQPVEDGPGDGDIRSGALHGTLNHTTLAQFGESKARQYRLTMRKRRL